jgi:cold shock CspA family protein
MTILYHDGNRRLQDQFDSRRIADRLEQVTTRTAFTDADKTFIESQCFCSSLRPPPKGTRHQMGRHNDYREPKRRGYDDDNTLADRFAGGRPNGPKASAPQGWQSVDAVVKWFNPDKGFGFVAVDGGFDAFLHVRFLEAAGYSSLPAGARIKVQNRPRPEGAAGQRSDRGGHKHRPGWESHYARALAGSLAIGVV